MKRNNKYLFLLITVLLLFPIFALINNQRDFLPKPPKGVIEERMKMFDQSSKEIDDFLEKERRMEKIIEKLGEPTVTFNKDSHPWVSYANISCGNCGYVLVWDKRNQRDKRYVLVISFDEKTKEYSTRGMGISYY